MAWELLVVERMPRARTRERPLLVGGAHLVSVGIGCLLIEQFALRWGDFSGLDRCVL